jgi:hypothetical protein
MSEIISPIELDHELLYGDTRGSDELRALIAQTYRGIESNSVLVTTGTAEANFLTLTSLLEPNDEVILVVPTYFQAYGIIRQLGARAKLVSLEEKEGYALPFEKLKHAFSRRTKLVFYTNPNNPTGVTASVSDVRAICEMAQERRAFVLCDEVLRGLEMDGGLSASPAELYEKGISTASLSKLGIRGIRIGWVVASDRKVLEQAWELKDYTTLSHSGLSEKIASAAMKPEKLKWLRERAQRSFRNGRTDLMEWVNREPTLLTCVSPSAGGSAFPQYLATVNSIAFGEGLLKAEGVLIAPGIYFGLDQHFRIKFVADDRQNLLESFSRITRFLRHYRS